MGDGRTYGDHRRPSLEGAGDESGPRDVFARRMPAALLALFLIAGVGVISYLAGRASRQEPFRSGREYLPEARQAPATLPATTLPQPASPLPSVVEAPPPLARMLEAQSRSAAAVAKQAVEKQPVIPATKERQSPLVPEFHPPRRVRVARRALVQAQRVLYASRIVQLGEYPNRRQAEAAHARLVRVYPYLKTLPKTVKSSRSPNGSPRAYTLRLKAYSPDHARILCQNLAAIGRGCAVMPEPA
ncbi:MAG: hypothetical protein M3R03_02540 [Pseudomonadota bacterium]|nr:hypothetical protein [Pseudomonadota bacterium]